MERSVAARFEAIAACGPDRIAVRGRERSVTYAALNRAANRVARAILARMRGRCAPVALVTAPGLSAVVAILGALKAGPAYVPIDAQQPPRWIASLLEDARPSLIVTDLASRRIVAAAGADARCVVEVDASGESGESDRDPHVDLSPDAPAYVIYTSGSTGRPKGAVHDQRHVLDQTRIYSEALGLGPDDCLTLLHSHAFSAARLDVFPALLNGAALMPHAPAEGLHSLAEELIAQQVTVLHWVPTAFAHFAATLRGDRCFPRLRWVVLGSEAVTRRHVDLHRRHFAPGAVLLNRYGTSETGSISWGVVNAEATAAGDRVPVGRGVGDVEIVVLDPAGHPVAPGQAGEIAVRSRFGFAGYLGRPDLTAAAFVPDPASTPDRAGGRIYLTGDLGSLSPDGELTHLGRVDFQVKVRGHRVELAEVERALLAHPGIADVAAAVREVAGEPSLVAYVTPDETQGEVPAPEAGALRAFLAARLPSYMIPAVFVSLAALPRTAGGKVDRGALPDPAGAVATGLPCGDVEATLSRIWAEVLGVRRVGADDSFFDLGGHSLHAARIAARVLAVYGVAVPLERVLKSPTVASLAEVVGAGLAGPPT